MKSKSVFSSGICVTDCFSEKDFLLFPNKFFPSLFACLQYYDCVASQVMRSSALLLCNIIFSFFDTEKTWKLLELSVEFVLCISYTLQDIKYALDNPKIQKFSVDFSKMKYDKICLWVGKFSGLEEK